MYHYAPPEGTRGLGRGRLGQLAPALRPMRTDRLRPEDR